MMSCTTAFPLLSPWLRGLLALATCAALALAVALGVALWESRRGWQG